MEAAQPSTSAQPLPGAFPLRERDQMQWVWIGAPLLRDDR
jgi:hypothetical protein